MTNLGERVAVLESEVESLMAVTENLTVSVDKLTTVLENGRGAIKLLCVLIAAVAGFASFITGIITWPKS